jgi:hypothetical protein
MDVILQPWTWYFAGPLIGLTVPLLLILGNKTFGISASLRHICAACIPANIKFFNYDWKKEIWNLFFASGIIVGGVIAAKYLVNGEPLSLNTNLVNELKLYGIEEANSLLPSQLFSWDSLFSLKGFMFVVVGGFLVGFGTRYAGGCTSGHAIMGLSNLQWPSLVAVCCFMIGGIITANFILPKLLLL